MTVTVQDILVNCLALFWYLSVVILVKQFHGFILSLFCVIKEAAVMQRVSELRKEGLWSSRRLPKVQESSRNKAHWDYLLEEMQWLAADFAQERKWKKAGARKVSFAFVCFHYQTLIKFLCHCLVGYSVAAE